MSPLDLRGTRPPAQILVAEDHEDSRDALRALLEAAGYHVALARNGREAVEHALASPPDLVVMDIMMPEMDGLEATRRLRAAPGFERLPIIALTALEGGRERALAAGCSDYVPKPINVSNFFRIVDDWVTRRAADPRDVPGAG